MATSTPNLGLIKPANPDQALIGDLDTNFDLIDTALGSESNKTIKGKILVGAGPQNVVGVETDIAGLTLATVPVKNNEIYAIKFKIYANITVADGSYLFKIRRDTAVTGALLATLPWLPVRGALDDTKNFEWMFASAATESVSLFFSVIRAAGTGDLDVNGGGGNANFSSITRVGNTAGAWTVA